MQNLIATFGHVLQTNGYSIPAFISDIRLSIRHSIQTFDYSIGTLNTNIQSKHSIRTFDSKIRHSIVKFNTNIRLFNSNIQFEHSIRTFNSNIQSKHSIQTFSPNIQPKHLNPGRLAVGTREREESDPEVVRMALRNFSAFSAIFPTIYIR